MPHKPHDLSPVSCLERETSFKEESFTPCITIRVPHSWGSPHMLSLKLTLFANPTIPNPRPKLKQPFSRFLLRKSHPVCKNASSLESCPHNGLAHVLISKRLPILCIELKSKGSDFKARL